MALTNVGHTIQKMINNTPVAVTTNELTTTVVTNGGNMYQSGLIGGKIQFSFQESITSDNFVGKIIDVESIEDKDYLLNEDGSVLEYQNTDNGPVVREVYSPQVCGGDKAKHIVAGRAHILILTEGNKIFGVGDNSEYQLVPQGQCRYDTATEIFVTDTNIHDDKSCDAFTGIYNEMVRPVIPSCKTNHADVSCLKETKCDVFLGYMNICRSIVNPPGQPGDLSIPIYGDISYLAFLCVDADGCVAGNVNWTLTRLYIKCGCFVAKFTSQDECGCHVREFNASSSTEILLYNANPCHTAKTDLCRKSSIPITGTSMIQGKCGSCAIVNIDLPCDLELPEVSVDCDSNTLVLRLDGCSSTVSGLCDTTICNLSCRHSVDITLDFDVKLDCEPTARETKVVELPQPCWSGIYAGGDISVLADNCNRLYVLGSIHKVRSNKDLLQGSCLDNLLNKVNASLSLPASELSNMMNRKACNKYRDAPRTDLDKFGIHLNFPNGSECDPDHISLGDFIREFKMCNESVGCDEPICEPCDGYIYLNVSGECGCPSGSLSAPAIGSIFLFNQKSVLKRASGGCPDIVTVRASLSTIVEYDLNKYCIDSMDIPLDKIVLLKFCEDGPAVSLYVDATNPGGVKFTTDGKCNVEFTVSASTASHRHILNYGGVMDPVVLTNLKYVLALDCHYPSPQYKNPFDTKLINTYLRGGDHVKFVVNNPKNIRQAITADIPTQFRLSRRVLDVAVGNNNLTVMVGGLSCPNELFAIGANCHGELGLGTNENYVCWKQLNRCLFDCQVSAVFARNNVTFYITQSQNVYASGQWKCFVDSTEPRPIRSICPAWKIRQIAIAKNHIVFLGSDGCIFGVGDNSVGELGLCHLDCVVKPAPLSFFYKINGVVAKQLRDNLAHPVESRNMFRPGFGGQMCAPCAPCGPVMPQGPMGPMGPNFGPGGPGDWNKYGPGYDDRKYKKNGQQSRRYVPNGRLVPNRAARH